MNQVFQTGREVSSKIVAALITVIEQDGYSADSLLVFTPYIPRDFRKKTFRLGWTEYAQILSNLTNQLKLSYTDLVDIGARHIHTPSFQFLSFFTSMVYSLPEFYSQLNTGQYHSVIGNTFNCFFITSSEDEEHNFVITLGMKKGYKMSPEFLYIVKGILGELPTLYHYHPIEIISNFTESIANYEFTCPYQKQWLRCFIKKLIRPFFAGKYIEELKRKQHEYHLQNLELEKQIIDLKATKNQLEEQYSAKRDFVACISHELRTPLNGILGMNHFLSETILDDNQKECVSVVHSSAEHLLEILNSILDYSKIDAGKRVLESVTFDLFQVIRNSCKVFSHHANNSLCFKHDIDRLQGFWVQGDPTALRQILFNLLNNAFKFTSKGEISVIARYENSVLIVQIRDTGIGIPEAKQAKIFEPFTQADGSKTRQYGGTGLGLTVTNSLVGQMRGVLSLNSEEGVGSTFTVSIPLVQETYSPHQKKRHSKDDRIEAHNILIVEDNSVNQKVISRFLESIGQNTTCVGNGLEAVEATEKSVFDLILMDIMMPVMSGEDASLIIRKQHGYESTPIVALTAEAIGVNREYYAQFGMNDYISKPINRDRLIETVGRYLRS